MHKYFKITCALRMMLYFFIFLKINGLIKNNIKEEITQKIIGPDVVFPIDNKLETGVKYKIIKAKASRIIKENKVFRFIPKSDL